MWYNTVSTGFDRLILFYTVIHGPIISDFVSKIPFMLILLEFSPKSMIFERWHWLFFYLGPI